MADEQDPSAPSVCPGCGCYRVCGRRNGDQVVVPYPVPSPWGGAAHSDSSESEESVTA